MAYKLKVIFGNISIDFFEDVSTIVADLKPLMEDKGSPKFPEMWTAHLITGNGNRLLYPGDRILEARKYHFGSYGPALVTIGFNLKMTLPEIA